MVQYRRETCKRLILDHLEIHGYITGVTALAGLDIARLSARIHEMRKDGYNIFTKKKWVTKRNKKRQQVTDRYILVT
jgi:hypothetical protein